VSANTTQLHGGHISPIYCRYVPGGEAIPNYTA